MGLTETIGIEVYPQLLPQFCGRLWWSQSNGQDHQIELLLCDLPIIIDVGDDQVL